MDPRSPDDTDRYAPEELTAMLSERLRELPDDFGEVLAAEDDDG